MRVKEKINERYCFQVSLFTEFSEVHVTMSLGLKNLISYSNIDWAVIITCLKATNNWQPQMHILLLLLDH